MYLSMVELVDQTSLIDKIQDWFHSYTKKDEGVWSVGVY